MPAMQVCGPELHHETQEKAGMLVHACNTNDKGMAEQIPGAHIPVSLACAASARPHEKLPQKQEEGLLRTDTHG